MSKKIKALVFDWDGTLMDSANVIVQSMHEAFDKSGVSRLTDEEVRNIIGLGLPEAIAALMPEHDQPLRDKVADHYRQTYFALTEKLPPLFEGVMETLKSLEAQGYFMAVATGKSRKGLDRALNDHGLHGFFHHTRTADETFSKPHPLMLQEIMDFLGIEPHETIMIGDSEYDILMARNAGTHAIGVGYGVHSSERLSHHGARVCISDIRHLSNALQEHFEI